MIGCRSTCSRPGRSTPNCFNAAPLAGGAASAGLGKNPPYDWRRGSSSIHFVGSLGNGPVTNPSTGPFSAALDS